MSTPNMLPHPEEELASNAKHQDEPSAVPVEGTRPFVLPNRAGGSGGKDKTTKMLLIAAALMLLLIFFFSFISTKGTRKKLAPGQAGKPNLGRVMKPSAPGQIVPADKLAPPQNATPKVGTLDAQDIERTKSPDMNPGAAGSNFAGSKMGHGAKSLGDVGEFHPPNTDAEHLKNWSPQPYPGGASGGTSANSAQQTQIARQEKEEYATPSMVFVAHRSNGLANGMSGSGIHLQPEIENFGLESGYHVAARMESMASTALHAPVTAVIEYNYERDGRVLIPAGARAVGKITEADASGIMNIAFSSIEMRNGETLPISAIGATTSLEAIKGRVTGKKAGRSFLVRSLAGLGEAGSMLVGQGNVNGAVSESDMMRERAAENIGSGADAQVMNMMVSQHIVVSVPAGTEIYLIFTKPQKINPATAQNISMANNTAP